MAAEGAEISGNGPAHWALPQPERDSHKYRRGAALVWSGPEFATGASRLAASAALRIGAGAVTIAGDAPALRIHAAHVTAIMLRPARPEELVAILSDAKIRAVCVGPAAGPSARPAAVAALQSPAALVLDADALTGFAVDADHLSRLVRRRRAPVVLTPHEGEFARLFPDLTGSRVDRARAAAAATGAILLLKGPGTIIAAPDGRATLNDTGTPWLATAGSGDVLAGFITGLLAQGMAGFQAAAAAAWLHGRLGEMLGPGLTADDLAGPVVRDLLAALQT